MPNLGSGSWVPNQRLNLTEIAVEVDPLARVYGLGRAVHHSHIQPQRLIASRQIGTHKDVSSAT